MKHREALDASLRSFCLFKHVLLLLAMGFVTFVPRARSEDETAEVVFHGRMLVPQYPGSSETVPMTAVYCFANAAGPDRQAIAFRTWETHPAGWYRLAGPPGTYSFLFSAPAGFVKPLILINQPLKPGDNVNRDLTPTFDYADFYQGAWMRSRRPIISRHSKPKATASRGSVSSWRPMVWTAPALWDRTCCSRSTRKPTALRTSGRKSGRRRPF